MKIIRTRQNYSSIEFDREPWDYWYSLYMEPVYSRFADEWAYFVYMIEDCTIPLHGV